MQFNRVRDYYIEDEFIFDTEKIEIKPGATVLVGCNGSGKTTTMNCIKNELKKRNIHYLEFDKDGDNGKYETMQKALMTGDLQTVALSKESSEGQNIIISFGLVLRQIRQYIRDKNNRELFLFIDAVDSGLDIANILEIKNLFKVILEDAKDKDMYIIVSTNSYEFAEGEDCLDVKTGKHLFFTSYEEYKKFILENSIKH